MKINRELDYVKGIFHTWCDIYDINYIRMEKCGNGVVFKIGDDNQPEMCSPIIDLLFSEEKILKYTLKCLGNLYSKYKYIQGDFELEQMMLKDR